MGNPFIMGAKYTGVEKIGDFRRKSPFISKTVRDRPMVTIWNVNKKSWVPDRTVSFSVTLSDPNPGFKVTVYLQAEYIKKRAFYGQKLLKNTIWKPYTLYRMVSLSMTLNDL